MRRMLCVAVWLAAGVAAPVLAQVQTGSILVRVTDPQGGVTPGVTITISSPVLVSGSTTAVTDVGGVYRFVSLPPASTYSVRVELQGFQTQVHEGVVVSAGQTTPLEIGMKVGSVSENVTVRGESPTIDTTSANVNVHIDSKILETTPSGRDIWSLIEYKAPGIVMATPDVGGNQGGLQRGLSSRGTSNGQNTQMLNGVNVGDPAAIGFAGYYYDPSAFEDIQVSSGAQDITVPSSGVFINMVTKSGTNSLSGSGLFTYQGEKTQWDNIDQPLQDAGLRPNAAAVHFITNSNFNVGGPVVRNKAFFFGAFNDQRTHVNVVGFPAPVWTGASELDYTDITSGFGDGVYQPNSSHKFTATYSSQLYNKPNRGAANTLTPESTFHERDVLGVYQGLWNWVLGNRLFANTSFSRSTIDFPLNLKTSLQTLQDLTTNIRSRAASNQQVMWRRRMEFVSNWQYFVPEFAKGRHELRFGLDNAYTPEDVTLTRNDNLQLTYRTAPSGTTPAGPAQVIFSNYPLNQKRAVNSTALYGQDQFTIDRLTLVGGVRWERVEGWVPAQNDPASQWFPEGTTFACAACAGGVYTVKRSFDEVREIPLWHNAAGRFNAIYDLTGTGKTAVKGSVAKYYDVIGTGTPGGLNPNGTITQAYTWNDRNGDLTFQNGEQGTASAPALPSTLEQLRAGRGAFNRPSRTEQTLGVDHELFKDFRLSLTYIHRKEKDQFATLEISVPFDYYDPIALTDPGRDGVVGTADDQRMTLYNERLPLIPSITQQTNDDRLDQRYHGFEISASKRYSNRWTMIAGYTYSSTRIDCCTNNGNNSSTIGSPNSFINAAGKSTDDRAHNFKLTGSYLLPYDIQFGGNFRLLAGQPITRTFAFSGLNQAAGGTTTVNVEPRGGVTLDWVPTIDLRIGKILRFGSRNFEADMDVYNLMNSNTVYSVRTTTGTINVRQAGDPNGALRTISQYMSPQNVLGPRIIRINLVYRFGGSGASANLDRDNAVK